MIQTAFFTAVILVAGISIGTAGTINGTWSPSSACGTEPEPPAIDQSSVDGYNNSVDAINAWQQKANTYNSCMVNEANADSAIITKSASELQSRFRATVEKIKADIEAAKANLNK
jgi:hypothetical protein